MSERSKGDTSSSLVTPAAPLLTSGRVVKNPLLSASVTGLTFDDFHNKPLLLPAAPPIVHPTPVVVSRESTPLVTVGKSSDIDTENLSEINLNDTSVTSSNISDPPDENSNSLIESTNQVDNSILSQAASSFSQLPSVASSVFSTFSKKFNSSSGRDDFNSNPQLDIQPFSTPFVGPASVPQSQILPPPPVFRNQEYQQQQQHQPQIPSSDQSQPQAPPAEPPTFYSPSEVPSAPSGPACPPPTSGQNTYRLSAKKKIYAQIPGLSSTHQEPSLPAAPSTGLQPPIGFESFDAPTYAEHSTYEKPEERKAGLFSLSNLGVPSVLQNLSGFVQSATGISQRPTEQSLTGQAPPTAYYPQANQVNFIGIEPVQNNPLANNFFAPLGATEIPPSSGPTIPPSSQPPQVPQNTGILFPAQAPPAAQAFFAPQQSFFQPPTSSSRPPSVENKFLGQPAKSLTPDTNPSFKAFAPKHTELSTSHPNLFGPPLSGPPPKSVTPDSSSSQSNLISEQAATAQLLNFFKPPPTTGTNLSGPPPKSVTPKSSAQGPPPNFFGPPKLETNLSNQQASSGPPPSLFGPPPTAGINFPGVPPQSLSNNNYSGPPPPAQVPQPQLPPQIKPIATPPSTGPPSSSFRLQKGTRLYKSPFQVAPPEHQPKVSISQNIFPPAPEAVNYFNPQQAFAPLQGQGISQPIPPQEPILKPVQDTPIPTPATAPQFGETPKHFATPEAVNFFNPQGFDSGFNKSAEALNIVEPLRAPEEISSKPPAEPINFFNPKELNSVPDSLTSTKEVLPEVQQPSQEEVSSTDAQSIDKPPKKPTISEGFTQQEITPSSTGLDTETVSISANNQDQSSVPDQNLLTQETVFSNQVPEQENSELSEQASKVNSASSEVQQESLSFLEDQQKNILPPPPAVSFGTPTSSKETANFPPPPPQHSFQDKPSSNPYRKGLQPTHTQLPAPASLSSFFTPIDQGNNFFQTINSGPIPEASQPAANFVGETNFFNPQENSSLNPPLDTFKAPEEPAPEAFEHPQETSAESENQQSEIKLSEPEPTLPIRESTPITSVIPDQNKPTSSIGEPLVAESTEKIALSKPDENPSFYKPDIAPPLSNEPLVASKPEENSKIASPLKSQDNPVPEPVPNLFTGFFDQAAGAPAAAPNPIAAQRPSLPDPTTFFDSFSLVPSLGIPAPPTEDPNSQRIQNFFNNPPPKELDTVGDFNYNLVGSGLSVQNLQIRSLTPASNIAEPPSSSCSEFSELNSSLSAANRQPLIQAADSTKVSPEEEAIFESPEYQDLPEEIVNELKMANSLLGNSSPTNEASYKPAVKHWFYKRKLDVKCLWTPFSFHDSALLEEAFLKGDEGPNLVAVEGGRFDVNISERTKCPVYWEGEPIEVKRCSWFYKASDSKYVPYEEEIADLLEEEYKKASESCEWHKKIPISAGDIVVFHGPTVIVHFQPQQQVDSWGGSTQTITRPRVVKRDLDDFNIDEGESHKVDHLLFMVHGIGSACDLKMRSVEEVVDEFRSIALQLVQSHYKNSVESGHVGRVEVLPVSWHSELHSEEFGIDEKLKSITLESIPKLRNFTNDTLLDILFYTSPMFCQRIINTVTSSMNDIFVKYKQRNPEFHGEVSLAGHSLGSLIMFDLLCHQRPHKQSEEKNMENPDAMTSDSPVESNRLKEEEEGKNITYKMGQAGTGQPFISYPQLLFQPKKFFALGSPIGMFVTIRGIDKLGLDFRLPTCPGFYNIFHPYDPVAYRLEALVNPDMNGIPPVLIPHHKGRKRMHLELKETMTRVGADLKQRFFETFKTTLDSVNFLTPKAKNDPKELKEEVDRLLELQAQQGQQTQQSVASTSRSRANSNSTNQSDTDVIEIDFPLGKLNDSKRVDYVLQEAPLEFFNEYLFALSSHVCYWESEDTILFVMKQIYNEIGISPDSQVPQQTMTIERPSSGGSTTQQSPTS
ncbi:mucin-2 isoform X2 [Eupeodes corollae]|uniref:mucin-2 isoform X2 n=1 Tax=Eupeodes corollae TaxID=290404 RepID=UPI00249214D4|nr:mucin-2 isoform X2 [Eupeodes corollae]